MPGVTTKKPSFKFVKDFQATGGRLGSAVHLCDECHMENPNTDFLTRFIQEKAVEEEVVWLLGNVVVVQIGVVGCEIDVDAFDIVIIAEDSRVNWQASWHRNDAIDTIAVFRPFFGFILNETIRIDGHYVAFNKQ